MVALVTRRDQRARLVGQLRGTASHVFCDRGAELAVLAVEHGAAVVLLEPRDADGAGTADAARMVRRLLPRAQILALCWLTPQDCRALFLLARAGVDEVLIGGYDDVGGAVQKALDRAAAHRAAGDLLSRLTTGVPRNVRLLVEHCLAHARERLSVAGASSAIGVSRRTLAHQCARAGLPAPNALVAWCRVVAAAGALASASAPVERVAHEFRFASAAGLRRMLRCYAGVTARELRVEGAECVYRAFAAALRCPPSVAAKARADAASAGALGRSARRRRGRRCPPRPPLPIPGWS